jgi:hypothetical protein
MRTVRFGLFEMPFIRLGLIIIEETPALLVGRCEKIQITKLLLREHHCRAWVLSSKSTGLEGIFMLLSSKTQGVSS